MDGAGEKNLTWKALRWLENAILVLVFANTVFYKSTILLIFEVELTESVLDKLSYPGLLEVLPWLARRKSFIIKVLR